ncbi:MAG: Crp/Fnr family transcriptional regulator, partial [Gammaproteobacteria bacterium]
IIETLKTSHLFTSLSQLQLERVYRHSRLSKLKEGQLLFDQGQAVDYFFMVISGKIKLFRVSPDGQEKVIEIVAQGGVFAEALMFMDQPHYPVSAGALADTEVIGIDAKDFKAMLWDSTDTCFHLMSEMSMRLRRLIHEIDTLTLHSGTCRVASYLLNSAHTEEPSFELDMAKNLIAARLSVKPETFSRIVANLKRQGILNVDGNKVTILNREGLKSLSMV